MVRRDSRLMYSVLLMGFVLLSMQMLGFFYLQGQIDDRVMMIGGEVDQLETKVQESSTTLETRIQKAETDIGKRIDETDQQQKQLTRDLESETFDNFKDLQDYIDSRAISILDDVEQRNDELERKIATIDVDSTDFTGIVDDVVPAVVSIKTDLGVGSGVLFDESGFIITNKHVVDGTKRVTAVTFEGDEYPATILGYGSVADIAVLKIEAVDLPFLTFEDDVAVGERAIAIGNPLGLSFTVTEGIVSAVNRQVDRSGIGYIQTDVSINPGNSGGPLINADREIIGINTFKISTTQGLGFAIPADLVESIAKKGMAVYEETKTVK